MRRLSWLLALVCAACQLPTLYVTPTAEATLAAPVTTTGAVEATATSAATPSPVATFTPTPVPTPSATPAPDPRIEAGEVLLLPQPLHAGDRLSVDVDVVGAHAISPSELEGATVTLDIDGSERFAEPVRFMGFDHQPQTRFYWITQLPEGQPTSRFTVTLELPAGVEDVDRRNNAAVLSMPLRPRIALPPPEPTAGWAVTETGSIEIHYLTDTAAERDLQSVMVEVSAAYEHITAHLGESEEIIALYLLDRVVGQGGYASDDWVAVTYADRSYSPVDLGSVVRHELVHRLDAAIGCSEAPAIVREGLAVYLAGGHYRTEPLRAKAAALLETTHFVPLDELAEAFHSHQHEVGYLEAGSVLEYLAEEHGWQAVETLCGAAAEADGDELDRWEAALGELGFASSNTLARAWRSWLLGPEAASYDEHLLEMELQLMDAMRAYQAAYDPAAHYLEGILFSPAEAERLGIVADFVRRPWEADAIAFELVLAMGQEALEQRDVMTLELLLEDLDAALATGIEDSKFVRDAYQITHRALELGWEPYRLLLERDGRYALFVVDRQDWPARASFVAQRAGGAWDVFEWRWSD
ncbi:MAG: hypothetical protein ACP5HG_08365 [Anaerolineae bacterium]